MSLVLDTHALLWLANGSVEVPAGVIERWRDASARWVSAASAYEIAYKTARGRLPGGQTVLDGWDRLLRQVRAQELPLSVAHMTRAGSLAWEHRDPFDRMVVAQAQVDGLTLLTADSAIRGYADVTTYWG
ncbi:MAG: type II toxin-antitoxin system VapC family toxin [Nocardioides sp.]|uniref:type II toxin-antitoxin system VapC family toxin n=1 Tax=Nocardioides sp. TaxID=35761 RepID=UPI0039E47313